MPKPLKGFSIEEQKKIDKTLVELDGTKQEKRLGANTILSVSLAASKAAAISKNIPLYKNIGKEKTLPFFLNYILDQLNNLQLINIFT